MTNIARELPADLRLGSGSHPEPNGDFNACVMEAVAYVAGEPWTDHPKCASPVIAALLRSWNDSMGDDDRQMLMPLVPRLVGTASTPAVEETRAWMATDWLVRECAPAWLRLAGLTDHAHALEGLAAVMSPEAAAAGLDTIREARKAGAAAGAAAGDAAGAAAWNAAWDAAWALVVRDLIGQHDLTQEHYDALTRLWREMIGPVHPDDGPLP